MLHKIFSFVDTGVSFHFILFFVVACFDLFTYFCCIFVSVAQQHTFENICHFMTLCAGSMFNVNVFHCPDYLRNYEQ